MLPGSFWRPSQCCVEEPYGTALCCTACIEDYAFNCMYGILYGLVGLPCVVLFHVVFFSVLNTIYSMVYSIVLYYLLALHREICIVYCNGDIAFCLVSCLLHRTLYCLECLTFCG